MNENKEVSYKNELKADKEVTFRNELRETREKYSLYLNINENDISKIQDIYNWGTRAIEYSLKEKGTFIKPMRGEIWSIDLGVNVGTELNNVRPCIILSENNYNLRSKTVTVVPISHCEFNHDSQFEINEETALFLESSLDGVAKTEAIRHLSKARMGRKIGALTSKGMKNLEKSLTIHLGLGSNYTPSPIKY